VATRPTTEIKGFQASLPAHGTKPPTEKPTPIGLCQKRKCQVSATIHIVRHDQQLPETRLAEIFRQQLSKPTPQVSLPGAGDCRRTAHELPETITKPPPHVARVKRGSQ
jgi:hypothetical protein